MQAAKKETPAITPSAKTVSIGLAKRDASTLAGKVTSNGPKPAKPMKKTGKAVTSKAERKWPDTRKTTIKTTYVSNK